MSSHPFKPVPTTATPTPQDRQAGEPVRLLVDARGASRVLAVCPKTLWNNTSPRGTIPSVRIGKRVLYSVVELQRWIDKQTEGQR
jgi:hypothetical protein